MAAQRGLPSSGALCGGAASSTGLAEANAGAVADLAAPRCAASWAPYIVQAEISPVGARRSGRLRAEVRDDFAVSRVWARVYPPSYAGPGACAGLIADPAPTVFLATESPNWFSATYWGFVEPGTYRLVLYAEDSQGLRSQPLAIEWQVNPVWYLPLIPHR